MKRDFPYDFVAVVLAFLLMFLLIISSCTILRARERIIELESIIEMEETK